METLRSNSEQLQYNHRSSAIESTLSSSLAESPPNFGINWRSHSHVSANSEYGGSGLGATLNNKNNLANGSSLTSSSDEEEDHNGYSEKRSRLKKCSSLKTTKVQAEETNSGSKISKKIVRFADVLGLDLERVKTFMDEIPKVPLSAFKDLSLTSDTTANNYSSTPRNTSGTQQQTITYRPQNPNEDRIILPNFHQPFTQPDFYQELHEKRVKLETAYSDHSSYIVGTVRVINLGFEKKVHIRCSQDDWQTWNELEATYNPACHDVTTDKFTFRVYMNLRLSFAIRYVCNGVEYWDNNNGANYSFNSIPNAVPAYNHVYNQVHW